MENLEQDHRYIARKLGLYHIEESAPGMVYWHPAGWSIYRELEEFIRHKMRLNGYMEVKSPQLLPVSLWEKSGHWEKFRENMFSFQSEDGRSMALKPMSCPCHLQIYNSDIHSWRDLPVRYSEFGACHRNESSGSLHGLMRTKAFEQDDAHVILKLDQVQNEVKHFVFMLKDIYEELGFPEFEVALSLRPEKRAGNDEDWDRAEEQLLAAARECGFEPIIQPGEGAFYGPKLEFALKDVQGRSWQCGTIQLDMVLPGRLGASYVDVDNKKKTPVMLHHAVLGSMGRFIGILLENNAGKLPFWLAPTQIAVLPVSEKHHVYAHEISSYLKKEGFRVKKLFEESVSRRIVLLREQCIPYRLVIGDKEQESGLLRLESADGEQVAGNLSQISEKLKSI